jgi:hypothetical protein
LAFTVIGTFVIHLDKAKVAVLILEAFNGTAPNLTMSGVPRVSVLNASATARRIALIPASLVVNIRIVLAFVYNIVFVVTASQYQFHLHSFGMRRC